MRKKFLIFLLSICTAACSCPGRYTLSNGKLKITFECSELMQSDKVEIKNESTTF